MIQRARITTLLKRRAPALAFVLLAFFGGLAIYSASRQTAKHAAQAAARINYQSQLQACQRGNELRYEINHRVYETNLTREVVVSFLRSAQQARHATFVKFHVQADDTAADAYAALARKESKLRYHKVPIVDCATAIKKP